MGASDDRAFDRRPKLGDQSQDAVTRVVPGVRCAGLDGDGFAGRQRALDPPDVHRDPALHDLEMLRLVEVNVRRRRDRGGAARRSPINPVPL